MPADPSGAARGPLHVLTYGDPGARPVAFCHGLFGQGRNWSTLGRRLGEEGWFVVLPDMPSHGRSAWADDVSYPVSAAALGDTLAGLSAQPWAVVGHSMGGKIAMRLALDRPALVERLCVVDISPVGRQRLTTFAAYVTALQGIDLRTLTDRAAADAALRPSVPDDVIRAFLLQNLRRASQDELAAGGPAWRWQMDLDGLGAHLDRLADWPDVATPPYPGPVLWVAGAESDYVRPEHGPAMRALFPQTRLVTVKHAGHWVHSEQPEVFGSIVRRFLTD